MGRNKRRGGKKKTKASSGSNESKTYDNSALSLATDPALLSRCDLHVLCDFCMENGISLDPFSRLEGKLKKREIIRVLAKKYPSKSKSTMKQRVAELSSQLDSINFAADVDEIFESLLSKLGVEVKDVKRLCDTFVVHEKLSYLQQSIW